MKRLPSIPLKNLVFALVILTVLLVSISCTSTSPTPTTTTPAPTPTTTAPVQSPTGTVTATPTSTVTATPTVTTSPTGTPGPTGTVASSPSVSVSPVTGLGTVEVLGVWGSGELDSFQAMVEPWRQQTGGQMNFTGTRDLTATLITRIQAGNPPDIAILPNPALMTQFANAGNLRPFNQMLNMNTINQQYPSTWINLGTVNNNLYGIFMKAANKSMIWYNPQSFNTNGWTIPTTWNDLISLSNTIVAANGTPRYPWSMGVENSQATGWVGTDWIAQIFLSKYGGQAYDQWVAHQIPWTDPRVKDAWQLWGTIVNTQGYVPGGATTVLATNFQEASYLPFQNPPQAAMYYEGDFVQGFVTTQFPDLEAVQDFDYFPFPSVPTTASPGASPPVTGTASPTATGTITQGVVTGGADVVVAFRDTPTIRSFIAYLASPEAQSIWVKRGGFISLNRQIALTDYPDPIAQKSVQQLLNTSVFRFGAGDIMPAAMQTSWWTGIQQYLQNPAQLDSILTSLENAAKTAYPASSTSPTTSSSP